MLVNDREMMERCTDCLNKEFFAFCKEHTEYTKRYIEYVFTSDVVYRKMIRLGSIDYFMEQFPDEANRLVDFVLSSDERFSKEFALFKDIYAFENKHPQYAGKLIDRALSIKRYVQRSVFCGENLIDMDSTNPVLAQKILALVLADDNWVFKFLRIASDFEDFFKSDLLRPIGEACLKLLCKNPTKFERVLCDDVELKKALAGVPQDQEPTLRLYYQLYTKKSPLTEVIDKHCKDPKSVGELQGYMERNLATLKPSVILHLRDHIAERLKQSEDSAETRSALVELQTRLVPPRKTEAENTDKLKFMGSKSNSAEKEPQKSHSPPKGQDFT
ncbi:MAG: hypothetical protein M3R00_07085, partial [Pseudomonadota bacterium]|nr:hypothetical protein [Pseudomonadota bacterium]